MTKFFKIVKFLLVALLLLGLSFSVVQAQTTESFLSQLQELLNKLSNQVSLLAQVKGALSNPLSSQTVNIAPTGSCPGGATMPPGLAGQTIRCDGSISRWVANNLLFNTGNTVGIGTITPNTRLHVSGGPVRIDDLSGPSTASHVCVDSDGRMFRQTEGAPCMAQPYATLSNPSITFTPFPDAPYQVTVTASTTLTAHGGNIFLSKQAPVSANLETTAVTGLFSAVAANTTNPNDTASYFVVSPGAPRTFYFVGAVKNQGGLVGNHRVALDKIYYGVGPNAPIDLDEKVLDTGASISGLIFLQTN